MKGYITSQILKEKDTDIELLIGTPVDPTEFFEDGKGLSVYSSFKERVLTKAKKLEGPQEYHLESLDLVQSADDKQIEDSLEERNRFKESDVCTIIAELISKQESGKEGLLLNNGYANLFYTPQCVVYVYWYGSDWDVHAWDRVDSRWTAGGRVFSPQLILDSSKS